MRTTALAIAVAAATAVLSGCAAGSTTARHWANPASWGNQVVADEPVLIAVPRPVAVDVETTGTRPGQGDRVLEIAIVTVSGERVRLELEALVDPERPIPYRVAALTRITPDMVRGKPPFDAIA